MDALDRAALEAFVPPADGSAASRRDRWHGSVAAVRGFYRFSCSIAAWRSKPCRRSAAAARLAGAPEISCRSTEVDTLIAQPDVIDAAGPARPRDDRAALCATGMRVSELVGVRAADLHLDEQ